MGVGYGGHEYVVISISNYFARTSINPSKQISAPTLSATRLRQSPIHTVLALVACVMVGIARIPRPLH